MKVVVDRDEFSQAFGVACLLTDNASWQHKHVKLSASKGRAVLMATDGESSVSRQVGCCVQEDGEVMLDPAKVARIFKEARDEVVTLSTGGSLLRVTGASCEFNLSTTNPVAFPSAVAASGGVELEMDAALLGSMIRRTVFCTKQDSARFALGGVQFSFADGVARAVGTDGRRMAYISGPASGSTPATAIIPAKAAIAIERSLGDGKVRLSILPNSITVCDGTTAFGALQLEGRFPQWERAIPAGQEVGEVTIPSGEITSAIRQASIVSDKESRISDFLFSPGSVCITCSEGSTGNCRVEIPADCSFSAAIRVDYKFISDFTTTLGSDMNIVIHLYEDGRSMHITTDSGYGYVVASMATDGRSDR